MMSQSLSKSVTILLMGAFIDIMSLIHELPSEAENARKTPVKEWKSATSYYEYIWKMPKSGYSGTGQISIKARLPDKHGSLRVGLDHGWLKQGRWADPGEEGAGETGFLTASDIKPGETKTFEVSAGPHVVILSDDFYSSDELTVDVLQGKTKKLECGENFEGVAKGWYSSYYLFHERIPGKAFYYLKDVGE